MKYIILQLSGKQYIMELDKWYITNYIKNVENNNIIKLNNILLFKDNDKIQLGKPFLKNSNVYARILQHLRGKKIIVLKTKPKKHYTRISGHRQKLTKIILETNFNYGT